MTVSALKQEVYNSDFGHSPENISSATEALKTATSTESHDQSIANILRQIDNCQTSYDIFRSMKQMSTLFNFSHFACMEMPINENQFLKDSCIVTNWPAEMIGAMDEFCPLKKTPMMEALTTRTEPLIWDVNTYLASDLSENTHQSVNLMKSFGLERGVFFSVHAAYGAMGAVSFCGSRDTPTTDEIVEIGYISARIYEKVKYFEAANTPVNFSLSTREVECLKWTAEGKTSAEISMIIGISEHTINRYLATICQKLNAQNRTHAVAIALRMKLLS